MKTLVARLALCAATAASAQHMHGTPAPATFVASSDKPFAALMNDAMAIMDRDMAAAPMNGEPGHDFVTMMMPHHQGAIDMAKAVLLHTQDPELRNLALGIIAEQQNEINVMRAWLERHPAAKRSQHEHH
ncbi:protein of unknown function [Massilia sp. PDC64]|nr:protein of unknown function [Massilia sp. PDC64]